MRILAPGVSTPSSQGKGVIVSDSIATDWRATGAIVSLPEDTTPIWDRLQDLTKLTWPTAAEQIERLALVYWLNPRFGGIVADTDVLGIAHHISAVGLGSDPECRAPLYPRAEVAWLNLFELSLGMALEPARPTYDHDTDHKWEEWSEAREAAGNDWWESVLATLDQLFDSSVISSFATATHVQGRLAHELQYRTACEILDTPSTVGANLYSGPLGNGFDVHPNEYKLHALNALALSTTAAADRLKSAYYSDDKLYEAAAAQHLILWMMLKGYVWAASSTHSLLSQFLSRDPGAWKQTEQALIDGLQAQYIAKARLGRNIGSNGPRSEDGAAIADTPIERILTHMESAIASSTQLLTPLR